jgi:hypothetical protein
LEDTEEGEGGPEGKAERGWPGGGGGAVEGGPEDEAEDRAERERRASRREACGSHVGEAMVGGGRCRWPENADAVVTSPGAATVPRFALFYKCSTG